MRVISISIWLACVFFLIGLSLVPHLIKTPNDSDKLLHVAAYCVLMLGPVTVFRSRKAVFGVAFALFMAGAAIEIGQHILGGRLSSFEDALANGVGVIFGLIVGALIRSGLNAAPLRPE